jgi:hypothetical protein
MKFSGHIWLAGGIIAMIVGMESRGTTFMLGLPWAGVGQIWALLDERRVP